MTRLNFPHCNFKALTRFSSISYFFLSLLGFQLLSACSTEQPQIKADASLHFLVKTIGPSVNIRSLTADGELLAITDDDRWRDLDASYAPNGDLVFLSNRKKNHKITLKKHKETYDLFRIKAGQTDIEQLTQQQGTELAPQYSPNGEWISYILKEKQHNTFMLMPANGDKSKHLLSNKVVSNYNWAPDGESIYVAHYSDTAAYVSQIDLASGQVAHLIESTLTEPTPDYAPNDQDPVMKRFDYLKVSPDGEQLAYIRNPFHQGIRQLRVLNLKTEIDTLISKDNTHAQDGVSWSTDSRELLFSALVGYRFYYDEQAQRKVYEGGMHIFRATPKGEARQITQGDHLFRLPTFSPDNTRIAYFYSDLLAAREYSLKAMNADGSKTETLAEKISPASGLSWN